MKSEANTHQSETGDRLPIKWETETAEPELVEPLKDKLKELLGEGLDHEKRSRISKLKTVEEIIDFSNGLDGPESQTIALPLMRELKLKVIEVMGRTPESLPSAYEPDRLLRLYNRFKRITGR